MENPSLPSCTRSLGIMPSMISLSRKRSRTHSPSVRGREVNVLRASDSVSPNSRTKYTPFTSRSSMATTLPAVFSSSILPSEMKAARHVSADRVAVHLADDYLFVGCRHSCRSESASSASDCRTFAENVPLRTLLCSQIVNLVLLFALQRPRCKCRKCCRKSKLQISTATRWQLM